jgi:predicted RNA-binding Zn-ribbon protein involved in translation (DUF1610 family)
MKDSPKKYNLSEWENRGEFLFGEDASSWKYRCPMCGNIQTGLDAKNMGLPSLRAGQICLKCSFTVCQNESDKCRMIIEDGNSQYNFFEFAEECSPNIKVYTPEKRDKEGERLFGPDFRNWKYRCPMCGNIQTGHDFLYIGIRSIHVEYNCIGNYIKRRGCEYVLNSSATKYTALIKVGTIAVPVFDFAEEFRNPSEDGTPVLTFLQLKGK